MTIFDPKQNALFLQEKIYIKKSPFTELEEWALLLIKLSAHLKSVSA